MAEALPGAALLAFDATNAFNSLPRQTVLNAVGRRAPSLLPVANAWLTRPTMHVFWDNSGTPMPVSAQTGVDLGCPLSPAFFAVGIADALARAHDRLQVLSPTSRLFPYLDDVLVVVPAASAALAHDVVREEMARAGLEFNADKTQIFAPKKWIKKKLMEMNWVNFRSRRTYKKV